jgi:hypothetical protein
MRRVRRFVRTETAEMCGVGQQANEEEELSPLLKQPHSPKCVDSARCSRLGTGRDPAAGGSAGAPPASTFPRTHSVQTRAA